MPTPALEETVVLMLLPGDPLSLHVLRHCSAQANTSFVIMDEITNATRHWHNISKRLRTILRNPHVDDLLLRLKQVRGFAAGRISASGALAVDTCLEAFFRYLPYRATLSWPCFVNGGILRVCCCGSRMLTRRVLAVVRFLPSPGSTCDVLKNRFGAG